MQRKFLKDLVMASYVEGLLNEKNVKRIADHLTRSELKEYIKALKFEEQKRTVIVTVPNEKAMPEQKELAEIFTGKNIIYTTDSDLILGMRIQDNDTIYDGNLKNSLQDLVNYVNNI